jgi:hypothetical protein
MKKTVKKQLTKVKGSVKKTYTIVSKPKRAASHSFITKKGVKTFYRL